jgi:Tfp pilus assembly protein PilN
MGELDLNLSTRPFPAYKFKTLLLTVAVVALVGISVWQVYYFAFYSSLSNQIRSEAQSARVDSMVLGRRLADMESKLSRPETVAKLGEIEFLNDIILHKTFSWTRMFATLERLTPDAVHLTTLRPEFIPNSSGVLLHIDLRGRSITDITQFMERLQAAPVFDTVRVQSETKVENEVEISLSVPYHPEREGQ